MSVLARFWIGLPLLLLLLCAAPAAAQDAVQESTEEALPDTTVQRDSVAAPEDESDGAIVSISTSEDDMTDSVLEFIVLAIFLTILIAIAGVFVGGFAAVSIFMDTGCLRFFVFALGWGPAAFIGLFIGLLLSEMTGLEFLMSLSTKTLFWGYPIAWGVGLHHAKQLPEDEFETWKQTLTGGALLGAGAGSVLNLARSAAVFKGGGGSFGGGGASGSFSGGAAANVQSVAAASTSGGSAAGAVALGGAAGAANVAVQHAANSSDAESSASPDADSEAREPTSWFHRQALRFTRWIQRFQWYHGCAFVVVALIFIPVGLWVAHLLQDRNLLIAGGVIVGLTIVYRLWKRWATPSPSEADSSFSGGGAVTSW